MDPLTQGLFGAAVNQYTSSAKKYQGLSLAVGFLAGMAADLDVLIKSDNDPLLFLHFHRQFTHSLIFIPIAALVISALLYPFLKSKISFKSIYLFSLLGYATHGLLDACTSYGTQLLWPFSDVRIAWNLVSVIDPLVTIPMLVLVVLAWIKRKPILGKLALAYAVGYIGVGAIQHYRVAAAIEQIAGNRGHQPNEMVVKPTMGNLLLWRSIYEYRGNYHVDAVRIGWEANHYAGASIPKFKPTKHLPEMTGESLQARDLERYHRYSDGYLAFNPDDPDFIHDIRYSMLPNSIKPLWGIRINQNQQDRHVEYHVERSTTKTERQRFLEMLKGNE